MAIPDPADPKSRLRQSMRRMARAGSHDSRAACDAVHQWLVKHPGLTIIAVFSALPDEPDLSEVTTRHRERTWIYPKVDVSRLSFRAVENPALELVPGAFGILEPVATLEEIAIDRIDAFLCPGLAFDPKGGRLGRGRGFYDRMLANARPDALKIGVCFPYQIVPDTFPQPHDIPMDAVIS